MLEFGKVWKVDTIDEFMKATNALDTYEFYADMSDDYRRAEREKAEIRRQRRELYSQASSKNLLDKLARA